MISRHNWILALLIFASVQAAFGSNEIFEWGGVDPDAYEIDQDAATIRILDPGGYAFRFYAEDNGDPGIINNITVDPNAVGRVAHPSRSEGWGRDSNTQMRGQSGDVRRRLLSDAAQ